MANTIKSFEESFELASAFSISRGTKTKADVVRVEISDGIHTGQGECVPYARYYETIDSVKAQIDGLPSDINRYTLQSALPAGAARNAVDCALWDLEAKQKSIPVWRLAGVTEPKPTTTAFTISLDASEKMQAVAAENSHRPLLKLKLGTPEDIARLRAVRAGSPASSIIVDANEGWRAKDLADIAPSLMELGVELIEQPLPENEDSALANLDLGIPICADESVHTSDQLDKLVGKYDAINIKLDKAGGLTQALQLKSKAQEMGFKIFIGCMVGTSLSMAPAMLLTGDADYVDLDGPLLLSQDRPNGLQYDGSTVYPPQTTLWG